MQSNYIHFATSCFQGIDQVEAYNKLKNLKPKAIQLCSGNKINKLFKSIISPQDKVHHNFSYYSVAPSIYNNNLELLIQDERSVHPPNKLLNSMTFKEWLEKQPENQVFEIMHPGYWLANDEEINYYLDTKRPIALDISHVYILKHQKLISDKTIKRIQGYDNIREIHISMNDGRRDSHQPATKEAFMVDWVVENKNLCPIVYEGNFHKVEALNSYVEDLYSWFE
jgi:hypothetical protein